MSSVGGAFGTSSMGRQYNNPTIAGLADGIANRESINRDGETVLRKGLDALRNGDIGPEEMKDLCKRLRDAGMTSNAIDSVEKIFGESGELAKMLALTGRNIDDVKPEGVKRMVDKVLEGLPPEPKAAPMSDGMTGPSSGATSFSY